MRLAIGDAMVKTIDICDVPVSSINLDLAKDILASWIEERKKVYVCVAPVSTIVDCQSDKEYRRVVCEADMVTPDGMPVVWLGKMKGNKDIERTYGPDLMLALCNEGRKKGYKHYFYGGTENTCSLLKNVLKRTFPNVNILGHHAPPIRPVHAREDMAVIEKINALNPDILWVGLGSPKQDFWMSEHRDKLDVPVMIGVGAAFDFIAGIKKQAPRWMMRSGLEWLFRLCSEPKRLWRRYLFGNVKFIGYVLRDFIKPKGFQEK